MYCIYRVTNNMNGKTYIGQHKYKNEDDPMYGYYGSGVALRKAYKKYGKDNFSIEVLYRRIQYKETADSMEIWMIEKERKSNVNGCYNISNGGDGNKGFSPSEETRKKMSDSAKKRPPISEETRRKLSEVGKEKHSGKRTDEQKRRISEAHKGQRAWNKNKKIGHWYNNGVKSVMTSECPEGFVPGRLPLRRNKDDNQ